MSISLKVLLFWLLKAPESQYQTLIPYLPNQSLLTGERQFHYFSLFPIFNNRRHFEGTKSTCQELLLHKAKNTPGVTLEIDHPFSHSVRLQKINEWAAEGKWLTSHKCADPDLLEFCLPNAKLNVSLLHSVYILPKSSLGFPPLSVSRPTLHPVPTLVASPSPQLHPCLPHISQGTSSSPRYKTAFSNFPSHTSLILTALRRTFKDSSPAPGWPPQGNNSEIQKKAAKLTAFI